MIRNLAQYSIKSLVKDYARLNRTSIAHSYLMYYHMGTTDYLNSIIYSKMSEIVTELIRISYGKYGRKN